MRKSLLAGTSSCNLPRSFFLSERQKIASKNNHSLFTSKSFGRAQGSFVGKQRFIDPVGQESEYHSVLRNKIKL